jgi:PHD/YefM family antitoxin component YafN of YafNO toxin-antitoxin module
MERVNALKLRNNLGEILDRLNATNEPIIVSKGRKIRAVLVTPEQFEKRFLDWQSKEKKAQFLDKIHNLKKKRIGQLSSTEMLRHLRGYPE